MIILMLGSGEIEALTSTSFALTIPGLSWLMLSCIVGTGISYAGWWCRGCTSATTYTVIGVVNKVRQTAWHACIICAEWVGLAATAGVDLVPQLPDCLGGRCNIAHWLHGASVCHLGRPGLQASAAA